MWIFIISPLYKINLLLKKHPYCILRLSGFFKSAYVFIFLKVLYIMYFFLFHSFSKMLSCCLAIINSVQTCSLSGCKPAMAVSYLVTWCSRFLVFSVELPTPYVFEAAAGRTTSFVLVLVLLLGSTTHSFSHTHTHSGRLFSAYSDEEWIYLPTVSASAAPL